MSTPAFSRKPQETAPTRVSSVLATLYRLLFALSLAVICLLWWHGVINDAMLATSLLLWLCLYQGKGILAKGYHRYRLKQDVSTAAADIVGAPPGVMYCYCHDRQQYCYLNSTSNRILPMSGRQGYRLTCSAFDAMVHPDDRESLKRARCLALDQGYFEHTYRLIHGTTEQRVLDRGVILRRDGKAECHGLLVDITRLEAGSALPNREEKCSRADSVTFSHSDDSDGSVDPVEPLIAGKAARAAVVPDSGMLRQAMNNGQLRLIYQPQVHGDSQRIAGFEVLLRWRHPDHGDIAPSAFIPIAESMGLMPALGNWIIDRACRQIDQWRSQGYEVPIMAINVSVLQLDRSLLTYVASMLKQYGLEGACLEFEITESRMMQNFDECAYVISGLRQQGIRIALDDFGTGYSSLDKLALLPLDRLKLDRSFVTALPDTHRGYHVIEAVVKLAHSLRLTVVAEGVETRGQQQLLNELGCEILQGYLFGAGAEADTAVEYLKRNSA